MNDWFRVFRFYCFRCLSTCLFYSHIYGWVVSKKLPILYLLLIYYIQFHLFYKSMDTFVKKVIEINNLRNWNRFYLNHVNRETIMINSSWFSIWLEIFLSFMNSSLVNSIKCWLMLSRSRSLQKGLWYLNKVFYCNDWL